MKNKYLLLIVALLVAYVFCCTGCGIKIIRGSGVKVTEDREVTEFTRISAAIPGTIFITQGEEHNLSITGDDNILALIGTKVENGELIIKKELLVNLRPKNPIEIHITLVEIEEIDFAGAGTIEVTDILADKLSLNIAGSTEIELTNLKANELNISLAGSGTINASGEVNHQEIEIAGSGEFFGSELYSETCNVDISGSADMIVNVSEELNVEISGSGTVKYIGDPEVSSDIAGSGKVEKVSD